MVSALKGKVLLPLGSKFILFRVVDDVPQLFRESTISNIVRTCVATLYTEYA